MASAGKILIMPKGEYSADVVYEVLDLVRYNNCAWVAKKTVTGIEPSDENDEYWHNLIGKEGAAVSVEAITNKQIDELDDSIIVDPGTSVISGISESEIEDILNN